MSKNTGQFNSNHKTAQGNIRHFFIMLFIIAALILLHNLNTTIHSSESAASFVTAGEIADAHTAGSIGSPSSEASSSLDGSLLNRTGKDYPDTMVLLDSIVDKIWTLESGRRLNPPDGDGGDAVGPLQLHLGVLKDVNKYFGFNFIPDDRKDLTKSKFIAKAYITMWIMENNEEFAVRIYNGGPRGWRSGSTDKYWQKYREIQNEK